MRRLLIAVLPPLLGACAPPMAQEPLNVILPAPGWGTAHIVLSGDYVGKQIRLSRNGRVMLDRRFTSPGPEHRLPLFTDKFDMWVQVEIEGCPTAVEVRVPVEPAKSTSLVFDGCSVRALLPE